MHRFRSLAQQLHKMTTLQSRSLVSQSLAPPPQRRYVSSPLNRKFQQTAIRTTSLSSSSRQIKRWSAPMVESNGDYREEAHLEEFIGGPLYSKQKSLPRLPIPTIENTIATFLPTALPLANTEEEVHNLKKACEEFPEQAAKLHERLLARKDEMNDTSWLQLWWNTLGYLQVRDPVVVNVSYFFHFSDDASLPPKSNEWSQGVHRAASILHSAAEFRKQICSGSFPQREIGRKDPKTPLCSTAYKYIFNACRVPRREQDTYRLYDPSRYQHCIIACKGKFYAFDFIDEDGDPLPIGRIEERLYRCVELASAGDDSPRLGWCTSSDRDSWADAREELLRVGGEKMNEALEKLESGALMICLDDEEPISRRQCADIFWTGGLSSGDNRWFDKSVQIMCTKNGKAGLIGEHSMADGMPMTDLADYLTKNDYSKAKAKSSNNTLSTSSDEVQDIFQNCVKDMTSGDSKVESMVMKAKDDFTTLITDHSLDVLSFQGYGSNYIKKAGYSPDAYAQMAIQLAIYRLHGYQAGTYEATQMRPYLHGRTETTRSVSPASAAFVKRMGLTPLNDLNDESARKEKVTLLQEAVKSHVKYIGGAAKGNGVDRHLFGLSMLVGEGESAPSLFSDPVYQRSKTWRVSTSHLTHPNFENWGFGEVVPDGVGVGYAVKGDCCIFNLTARREHGWTERLGHFLEEALLEMQLLNDMANPPKSKL